MNRAFPLAAGALVVFAASLGASLATLPPPQARTGRVVAQADWLVGQLQSTEWQSSYEGWKAKHPRASCRTFHGDGSALFLTDEWSYRCSAAEEAARASRYFYVMDDTEPAASRLHRFQGQVVESPGLAAPALELLRGEIESRLTRLYGAAEQPASVPAGVLAFGSADWRALRIWHTGDRDIYLYRTQVSGAKATVGLLARDRALELASTRQGQHLILDERPDARFEDGIDTSLVNALGAQFPRAADLLGDTEEQPDPDSYLRSITELLAAGRQAPLERRAALLLAADRLADRWPLPNSDTLAGSYASRTAKLKASDGMHFAWSHLAGAWIYQHDLLWTIWRDAPASDWGQDAFFLLIARGWDTSGVCRNGSDQFRAVITQGESDLGKYPGAANRLPVLFLVAQAYETWWSLSQWWNCSPLLDPSPAPCGPAPASAQYQPGAAAAREKAIADYDELMKAEPAIYATPELRRHLARLKLGIDTNERRFYCVYD
ncbi:MAG TPA: hypothetical protein VGS20_05700 [Candidatus Acidoferrales bacterium]|nr:hypothetical protein [Candidatus Acidoferrales bacterium]